ncbi:S24 family peptidase [Caldicellulosiruptoraceae bacterium PP1]
MGISTLELHKKAYYIIQNKKYFSNKVIKVKVRGYSMLPSLKDGDMVYVQITNDFNLNDIVLSIVGEKLIIHRIIDINGNTITMKGDNTAPENFEIIIRDNIIGKVFEINKRNF